MTGMKRIEILRPWAFFVWLFVWQAGVLVLDQQILLVSPVRVLLRLVELAVELDFWKAVAFSTLRITAGFLLAYNGSAQCWLGFLPDSAYWKNCWHPLC